MKLSDLFETDEALIGFLIGIGFIFILGLWAVLLGVLCAVLYRLGGMGFTDNMIFPLGYCFVSILLATR